VFELDRLNRVVKSSWSGESRLDHPDFIWVPTGNAESDGYYENPRLDEGKIQEIIRAGNGAD
jgi:hypothetical protein